MSRPSTPSTIGNNHGNAPLTLFGCDANASTSTTTTTWPLTELALETPERLRLHFKKQYTSPNIMPSASLNRTTTIRSPQTPRLNRSNQQKPGEYFFKAAPSPLRRFKISQSSTPLSEKFGKSSTSRIEYRFRGNEPLPIASKSMTPLLPFSSIEPNLNLTSSSTTDSGIYSSMNDSSLFSQSSNSWEQSNIFDDCNIFTENNFHESFNENSWEYSSDSFMSQTSAENQFIPTSLSTSFSHNIQPIDFNASFCDTPAHSVASVTSAQNVTVSNAQEIENEEIALKAKQKSLEDEVFNSLDKYHDEPFNIDYSKDMDMTEFKKLKLMSSLSSSWYKTVLGRSKEQLQITREAHKYLNLVNPKRVKDRK